MNLLRKGAAAVLGLAPAIRWRALPLLALLLAGCASRPVNPPITQADPSDRLPIRSPAAAVFRQKKENLVILAFSGGGTRAAAFSYGVLEFLRNTESPTPKGNEIRLLDTVDLITGVSGGSFTALAYGLYGDKLFDDYETRFLKRDVQGESFPAPSTRLNWPTLWSDGRGPIGTGGASSTTRSCSTARRSGTSTAATAR